MRFFVHNGEHPDALSRPTESAPAMFRQQPASEPGAFGIAATRDLPVME